MERLRPTVFDGAAFVEELEHVSFVGLIPGDFHGGDGAEIEALDEGRVEESGGEGGIFGDGGDDERRANFFEHLGLVDLDDGSVRAEEFPIGERVIERGAEDDGGAEVNAAVEFDFSGALAEGGGEVLGTWRGEIAFDGVADEIRHFGVSEAAELGEFVFWRERGDGAEFFGEGGGDFGGVFGDDHRAGIDAGASAVIGDGSGDDIDEVGPVFDLIVSDEDFAEAWSVDGEAGIITVLGDRIGVAEDERAAADFHDFGGAFVISGVEAESLWWGTGGDEGLDEAVRGPGFFAAGFNDHGGFEGDGGEPEGIDGWGVAGHDEAERVGGGVEGDSGA